MLKKASSFVLVSLAVATCLSVWLAPCIASPPATIVHFKVGERLTNLERCFNLREGLRKSDDTLPDRFTKETLPEGASKGQVVGIDRMVDRYYELRGWDVQTGVPTRATLDRLGLGRMADELGLSDGLAASALRAEPGPK